MVNQYPPNAEPDEIERYEALRAEGYSAYQARLWMGWADPYSPDEEADDEQSMGE